MKTGNGTMPVTISSAAVGVVLLAPVIYRHASL